MPCREKKKIKNWEKCFCIFLWTIKGRKSEKLCIFYFVLGIFSLSFLKDSFDKSFIRVSINSDKRVFKTLPVSHFLVSLFYSKRGVAYFLLLWRGKRLSTTRFKKKKKKVFELKLTVVFQAIIIKFQSSVPSKKWVSIHPVSLTGS